MRRIRFHHMPRHFRIFVILCGGRQHVIVYGFNMPDGEGRASSGAGLTGGSDLKTRTEAHAYGIRAQHASSALPIALDEEWASCAGLNLAFLTRFVTVFLFRVPTSRAARLDRSMCPLVRQDP